MYTKCIPHFDMLLHKFCIQNVHKFLKMWNTFWIHFVYIKSDLQKVFIIKVMYRNCTQKSRRIYVQIIVRKMGLPLFNLFWHLCCALHGYLLIVAHN